MRWSMNRLPNIRSVMDRYHLYDRILDRNRVILKGHGTPCTYWSNKSIDTEGRDALIGDRCYCWDEQRTSPDKRHFLCMGTGYIGNGGWQKYGYQEHTFASVSQLTKSSDDLIVSGTRNSILTLSGNTLSEYFTTERIKLDNFLEVSYLLFNESIDPDNNRLEYAYSIDDITWYTINIYPYNTSRIANKYGNISLPIGTEYIRFKVIFKKRTAQSSPPKWNSIRFRYRNMINLKEIDPRYNINIPSFLASRQSPKEQIKQGETGWETTKPVRWWTLPEAEIEEPDIIMFLQGTFEGQKYKILNLNKNTYGPYTQILHREFETKYIRDEEDLGGIIYLLM